MRLRSLSGICVAAVLACPSLVIAQDRPDLDVIRDQFASAFNAGDVSALGQLYSDDVVLMPPDADRVEGRDGAEGHFALLFSQAFPSDLEIESQEMRQLSDAFVDIGTYSMNAQGPEGQAVTLRGDYMTVVELGAEDRWIITRHIWNQDMPAQ
jgi:uncharacterized protein (TIGR02246 family)